MLKKKWVRWVLVLGILLFVVVPFTLLLITWIFIDPIGERIIEAGGSSALGVRTEVGSFHCSILSGSVAINNMTIDDPPGFDAGKKTLNLGHAATGVSLGSLTGETIEIQEMTIDGLQLYLEANETTTNVQAILAHVQGEGAGATPSAGEPGPTGTPAASAPEKRFKIAKIRLAHIGMELKTTWPVASKNAFEIPAFEMTNLWRADGQGYTAGELLVEILNRTTKAGLQVGGQGLSDAIKQRLMAEMDKVGAKLQMQAQAAASQAAEDLKKDAAKSVEGAIQNVLPGGQSSGDPGKAAGDAAKDAGKDLKKDANKLKNPFK